jgi:hypothetical protein
MSLHQAGLGPAVMLVVDHKHRQRITADRAAEEEPQGPLLRSLDGCGPIKGLC